MNTQASHTSGPFPSEPVQPADPLEQQTRLWGLILHLSLYAGYVVPLAGLVAPVIIWQLKKGQLPGLDAHGKVVVNWILSAILYTVAGLILMVVGIGFLVLFALAICSVVFPIVGAIKAHNGELWRYPLSIRFLR